MVSRSIEKPYWQTNALNQRTTLIIDLVLREAAQMLKHI